MILIQIAQAANETLGSTAAPGTTADLQSIVLNIYNLALLFGGLLAFVMILFASVKYTLQPGNSSAQGDAKDQILQAFFGLLLLFGAYLVLNTINPEIVNIEFPQLSKVEPPKEIQFAGVTDCSKNFQGTNECRSNYGSANGCPQSKPSCVFDCKGGYKCTATELTRDQLCAQLSCGAKICVIEGGKARCESKPPSDAELCAKISCAPADGTCKVVNGIALCVPTVPVCNPPCKADYSCVRRNDGSVACIKDTL